MTDYKDLSAKVFGLGTISLIILALGKIFLTDSTAAEIVVPTFIIWIMFFFVSAMMYSDGEKRQKEKKEEDWRQEIEDRLQELEENKE